MENTRANEIIIEVLQNALKGKIRDSDSINLPEIAKAIAFKVEFEKPISQTKSDHIIENLLSSIDNKKNELKDIDYNEEDEKLLSNFVSGKLTAYDEIIEIINEL
ncbi:hypothetical protein M0Q50_09610 [bacterium]|jgi:hypothetical protein|nr:hypothetical protein [bacterium]